MQEDFLMTIDGDRDWNMDDMDGGFGDLDLNFGDQPFNLDDTTLNEDSMAVEMARDAAPARSARESLASNLQLKGNEGDLSLPNGDERNDFGDMDLDMGDVGELNLDFGDILGNPDITQTQNGQSEGGSRRCKHSPSRI
jgi:cohesin complex subunit SCC1